MSTLFERLFFELYESLPRQGPGNFASVKHALELCPSLPSSPYMLDLGCGVGAQTFHLLELAKGKVVAVDNHPHFLESLRQSAQGKGMCSQVQTWLGSMDQLDTVYKGFDLIWSEGALYQIGIANALELCRERLKPSGLLVFSDAVWLKSDPPNLLKQGFDADYPGMGRVQDVLKKIKAAKFETLATFTLPDKAWWEDFYVPMQASLEVMTQRYSGNEAALKIIEELAMEPELHRQYSDYYAYEFFVARRQE